MNNGRIKAFSRRNRCQWLHTALVSPVSNPSKLIMAFDTEKATSDEKNGWHVVGMVTKAGLRRFRVVAHYFLTNTLPAVLGLLALAKHYKVSKLPNKLQTLGNFN